MGSDGGGRWQWQLVSELLDHSGLQLSQPISNDAHVKEGSACMWTALTYSVALPGVRVGKLNSSWSLTVERRRDLSLSPSFMGTSNPSYEDEQENLDHHPMGNIALTWTTALHPWSRRVYGTLSLPSFLLLYKIFIGNVWLSGRQLSFLYPVMTIIFDDHYLVGCGP